MGIRSLKFLSGLLLAIKGYECSHTGSSTGTSASGSGLSSQSALTTNQITVPAIIKPILTPFDQNLFNPATQQSYGYAPEYFSFPPAPMPPPMPPIIIDSGKGGNGGNDFLGLMLLLLALKGKNGGSNTGCGYNGGYGSGYGSSTPSYPSGYGGGNGPYTYPDVTPYVPNSYGSQSYGSQSYGSQSYGNNNVAEVTVTEGYYIDEPVVTNPYQYQTIQPYPGREPNEICLIVRTDYPPIV